MIFKHLLSTLRNNRFKSPTKLIKLIFIGFVCAFTSNAQTFTWQTAFTSGYTLSETVNGITITVAGDANGAYEVYDFGGYLGTSGNFVYSNGGNIRVATITFSEEVNIQSVFAVEAESHTSNWTFHQTGGSGSNSDVVEGITANTAKVVALNWTGVTSLTITTDNFLAGISFDDIVINTSATAPTTQASNVGFSSTTVSTTAINWTRGDGDNCAVFMAATSLGTASPLDNTTYTANTIFGSGTQIGSTAWYCVYNGSGTSATVSGLSAGTTYRVHVCEYNEGAGSQLYLKSTGSDNPDNVRTLDTDGNLSAAVMVTEPISINTTIDSGDEAVSVFDFTLSDGGGNDGLSMDVSQVVLNVSGTSTHSERAGITWRLNGPDASNVTGTYSAGVITFSGLSISVADGTSEIYTVNAYYNNNTGLTEGHTFVLNVDGDTDLTLSSSGTQMGNTSAVTNGDGSSVDVIATRLYFLTQPDGSVSGEALSTQAVVVAMDAYSNTDTDFDEIISLSLSRTGTLTNATAKAAAGVATFSGVTYTATYDNEGFMLIANDQDDVGTNLPTTTNTSLIISDVVASQLAFTSQPTPLMVQSGIPINFTIVPTVTAVDANGITDHGYTYPILLSEVNGAGSATMSVAYDEDGSDATVTISPMAGVATFTDMQITYTAIGGSNENFNLRASSQHLTPADCNQLEARQISTAISYEKQEFAKVWPNPSTGVFYVSDNLIDKPYELYSLDGTMHKTGMVTGNTIDLTQLEPSCFLLKINGEILRIVKK